MDFGQIYHFLFETYAGVACLVGVVLIITFVLAVLLERRTRKVYKDRPKEEDEWLDANDEEDE